MTAEPSGVIQASGGVGVAIGRRNERKLCQDVRELRHRGNCVGILLDTLTVGEEEELVLEDRSADGSAKLVALEGRIDARVVAKPTLLSWKFIEALSVEGVGAGAGRDQDLAGRGEVAGDVLRRAVDLELVDRTLGDVEDGGADGLVGDVLSVEEDAGGAAGDAVEGEAE